MKKTKKQIRLELEQKFIGSVLTMANSGDIRETVAGFKISWRRFVDKRHRAIWRALEALNLKSIDERMDIIEEETYSDAVEIKDEPGIDPVRGVPGSAASKQFMTKLITGSLGLAWLMRELESAAALKLVGGKKYLQEIAEIGEAELSPNYLAAQLFKK